MLSNKAQVRTPITYYGGKQMMAPAILQLIPSHKIYVELFLGGGAIYFAKEPSDMEVINDLNGEVINFYKILRTEYLKLNSLIQATPHSRSLYHDAMVVYKNPHLFDEIKRAWAFWILTNQGWGSKIGSWGYDIKSNKCTTTNTNKRLEFGLHLEERLSRTQIECQDAIRVLKSRDTQDTFFYIDPPYPNSNQGHYSGYSMQDFSELLDALSLIEGKFLLSSYPIDILNEYITKNGWYTQHHDKSLSVSNAKRPRRKVEMLTANYLI